MLDFQKTLKLVCQDNYVVSMLIKLCFMAADSRLLTFDDPKIWKLQQANIEKTIAILKMFESFDNYKLELIRIKKDYYELSQQRTKKLLFEKSAALNSMIDYFEKNNEENNALRKGISAAISFLGDRSEQLQQKIALLSPPAEKQKIGVFLEQPLKPYLPQVPANTNEPAPTSIQTSTVLSHS